MTANIHRKFNFDKTMVIVFVDLIKNDSGHSVGILVADADECPLIDWTVVV